MQVLSNINEVQNKISNWVREGKTIGFVPTMGYLHEGHKRLLGEARKENDVLVMSIFVNPLQFGENEDLDRYPRDEERDRSVARQHDVDLIFLPDVETMYPKSLSVELNVKRRTDVLCGKSRPGHFDGVVTVLTKLFNICRPDRVYFGLKDAQQLAIVNALIEDFNFPIELIAVPTVRESDGLAKSSRNVHLTDTERKEAPSIQKALQAGRNSVADGSKNPEDIITVTREFLEKKTHGKIDYIELLSYPELNPVPVIDQQVILAVAVNYEKARLIDNIVFDRYGNEFTG